MATTTRDDFGRASVSAAFERCTERRQVVVTLLLLEGLSVAEAAGALGTTTSRIRRSYREALDQLKDDTRRAALTLSPRSRRYAGERLRKAS